jgi:tetratricopeptide (TPR) repeat protein
MADVLAYHYQEALELARAAGDDESANGLLPAARRTLTLAGDRAAALDVAAADAFYRRAIALYDQDDPAQAALLLQAGRTAATLSGIQAEKDAARAADLYRSTGDELGAAEALLDLTRYVSYRGSDEEERECLQEAQRLVERHPPGRVFALYLARKAGNDMMAGRATECIASSEAAIAMAKEFGETEYAAHALQYRGVARTELGDLGGLDDIRESIEHSLEATQALATGIGYVNLADSTWMSVGAKQGLELHETTQAFDQSRGLLGAFMWSRAESTWMLFDLGRWDEILAITDELATVSGEVGTGQPRLLGLPYRALVLERRGDPDGATVVVEHVLPKAKASANLQLLVPALAVAALVAEAHGDGGSALGFVHEMLELTRGRSDRHRALFLPEVTRICTKMTAFDLAHELAEGLTVDLGRIGCARTAAAAVLAEAEERVPEALALYEQAATRWRDFGSIPGRAEALLGQARCLISLGERGAEEPLTEARDLFASMGHRAGLAEAENLLA